MTILKQTKGIMEALVACGAEGVRLQATSPLVESAEEWLRAAPTSVASLAQAMPVLPPRVALSPEDRERRRATLGSSEIAAVAGVNPYASMHDVWLAKVMGVEFEGNERTELGNLLEPTIFAIYADRYGRTLTKGVYTLGPEPWMAATPDARIVGGGLVEAKLVGLRSIWMWGTGNTDEQESDAIPLHYLCQAQWQMAVTGESFVDVSALMGTEFRSYTIRSNPDIQAKLIARGRDFWQRYVVTRTPPPVDGSDGARAMLKALYPRSGGDFVSATPKVAELVEELRVARAEFDRAKDAKALRENQIKAELGNASGVLGDGWRIRYSTTKAGSRPFCFDDDRDEGGKAA